MGIRNYLKTHPFLPLFLLSTLLWTVGEILQVTNASVYVANNSPISHRGRFNAITGRERQRRGPEAVSSLLTFKLLYSNFTMV